MKKRWGLLFLLLVCASMLFAAWQMTNQIDYHLQYIIKAPAPSAAGAGVMEQSVGETGETGERSSTLYTDPLADPPKAAEAPNQAVAELKKSLDANSEAWGEILEAYTLSGTVEKMSFTSDREESEEGKLTLLGEGDSALHTRIPVFGRLLFPEELKNGERVMLLDEQLALSLFGIADPLERTVTIGEEKFRVVGILRHRKQVGDYMDSGAYISLAAGIHLPLQLDSLMVEGKPIPGKGAPTTFAADVRKWVSGGTFINLGKERMGATLWLRVLLFAVGMAVALKWIGWMNRRASRGIKRYKEALQHRYPSELMLPLLGVLFLLAVGYLLGLIVVAVLMNFIIEPVYTFTEWIPAVLVEWQEIAAAFWKVWQPASTLMELRSPELIRIRFLALMVQVFSAGAVVLLLVLMYHYRRRFEQRMEMLLAKRRSGVVVALEQTTRPLPLEELGYLRWTEARPAPGEKRPMYTMIRILRAEEVLRQLPPSAMEGVFTLEVVDEHLPANRFRWLIRSDGVTQTMEPTTRDWDLQLPVQTLAQIVYGRQSFQDFLETHAGYDMRMRNPAMDGLFANHLEIGLK